MRTDKWLYFRTVTDVDDDDGQVSSISTRTSALLPSNRLIDMAPQNDTTLRLMFYAAKYTYSWSSRYKRTGAPNYDYIDITINTNKHKDKEDSDDARNFHSKHLGITGIVKRRRL